jgi:hypothetical protein
MFLPFSASAAWNAFSGATSPAAPVISGASNFLFDVAASNDPTSVGANFRDYVGKDIAFIASFWGDRLVDAKDMALTAGAKTYDLLTLPSEIGKKLGADVSTWTYEHREQIGKSCYSALFRTNEELGISETYDFAEARTILQGNLPVQDVGTWTGVFNIRNDYDTKLGGKWLPHASRIYLKPGEKNYDFTLTTSYSASDLKGAKSINLIVHGYNTDESGGVAVRDRFVAEFKAQGYKAPSALLSWSSDVGSNFLSKGIFFNRDVQSADISWPGLANVSEYLHEINKDLRINVVTHSLGLREILVTAKHGVKFGTVVALVPAIDNEALCAGGEFEGALKNIDRLVIVYSGKQHIIFGGAYRVARFDNSLGYSGPSGNIAHNNYVTIDATANKSNVWGVQINHHGDLYGSQTIKMITYYLSNEYAPLRIREEELWERKY